MQVLLTDRNAFEPVETGLSIVRELKDLFGDSFDVDRVNRLLVEQGVLDRVKASSGPTRYTPLWARDRADFLERRAKFLLYDAREPSREAGATSQASN